VAALGPLPISWALGESLATLVPCYVGSSSLLVMRETSTITSVEISSDMRLWASLRIAAGLTVGMKWKRMFPTGGGANGVATTLNLSSELKAGPR